MLTYWCARFSVIMPSLTMRQIAASKDSIRETLINSADEMKHEAHGTQQPRHINTIGADASTAQQSDSLV